MESETESFLQKILINQALSSSKKIHSLEKENAWLKEQLKRAVPGIDVDAEPPLHWEFQYELDDLIRTKDELETQQQEKELERAQDRTYDLP